MTDFIWLWITLFLTLVVGFALAMVLVTFLMRMGELLVRTM